MGVDRVEGSTDFVESYVNPFYMRNFPEDFLSGYGLVMYMLSEGEERRAMRQTREEKRGVRELHLGPCLTKI